MNNNELKKIKELTETICKECQSYEETIEALKAYLTNITDPNTPRKKEFEQKFNVLELANSKSKMGLIYDYKDTTKLIVNYYMYDKAPHGIAIILNQMEKWKDDYLQKDIDIFIKED